MADHRRTLVLDTSYMPRSIISTERAFAIFYKGNGHVIHEHPVMFGVVNPDLMIYKPSIIRINRYVNSPYQKVALSRENVFKRDEYTCVYCGNNKRSELTLDHIIPRSKGGGDTWENLVTACKKCNTEKGDLSLKECGFPVPKPTRPHYLMLLKTVTKIPAEWRTYLFM